ncbi:MAG: peptidase MA family metallohydrolase [Bacilli bacterium]
MEKRVDNNLFIIYASRYFDDVILELSDYLEKSIKRELEFFNLEYIDKLSVYLYDSKDEYQKVFKALYPPSSMAGSFGYEDVRIYVDLDKVDKYKFYSCVLHELTHVIYKNYIQEKGIKNRIIWFDEGLATYLSGQKNELYDENRFGTFISTRITGEGKEMPNISFLHKHGSKYGEFLDTETEKYNGYDWSYLMIRYLIETLSKKEFDELMRSKNKIMDIESNIVNDTYNYFTRKIKAR